MKILCLLTMAAVALGLAGCAGTNGGISGESGSKPYFSLGQSISF